MRTSNPADSTAMADPPRRPGRPIASEKLQLTREVVFARGLQMTRTASLHDIKIVDMAREFGITTTLIHYLVGNREQLHSGIANAFCREVCGSWPEPKPAKRDNIKVMAEYLFGLYKQYPGISSDLQTRSRPSLKQIPAGEVNYGLSYMELVYRNFLLLEQSDDETILLTETFMDFLFSQVRASALARLPADERVKLRDNIRGLPPETFPALLRLGDQIVEADDGRLFDYGLELLLTAVDGSLPPTRTRRSPR